MGEVKFDLKVDFLSYNLPTSREFAGQILLVEGGNGIFLDVVWLSDLMTPILSHKLKGKSFHTRALCQLRDVLVHGKILRWEFARHLWREVLEHSAVQSSEAVGYALYRVLIKLGVAIPLRELEDATACSVSSTNNQGTPPSEMLVIMRLLETCSEGQQTLLDSRIKEVLTVGVRDVTLKWEFDAAGCPYGLMERLIASCHVVGVVEYRLCWRYGALFQSRELTRRFGQNVRSYTMVIRYDIKHDPLEEDVAHVLTVQMIGPLENPRVWAALRFVASAVITLAKEWPGVILKGSPVCPRHPLNPSAVYLTTPNEVCEKHFVIYCKQLALHGILDRAIEGRNSLSLSITSRVEISSFQHLRSLCIFWTFVLNQAHIGGPLIPEGALGTRSTGCDCHRGPKTIVGLVVEKLGLVIDIEKGSNFFVFSRTRFKHLSVFHGVWGHK